MTAVEVAAVGESMVVLTPAAGVPLETADRLAVTVGGAESNVVAALAGLGHRTRWLSRVGDDPFGRMVTAHVAAAGVATDLVEVDGRARTGLYAKDPGPDGTRVHYHRAGSAATRMGPAVLDDARLAGVRILHLSGITPVLSRSCRALVEHAVCDRPVAGALISFDVNHRPGLWPARRAAPVLHRLADRADVVFVGLDEAQRLWDTRDPHAVRRLLPGPRLVVVKDGPVAATALPRADPAVRVPALPVPVVEPVGAGDAFAAGFLSGLLRGLGTAAGLRLGHLLAARTLAVAGDNAPPADRELLDTLVALPDADWARLDPATAGILPAPAQTRSSR
ncbi:2-dehydro-3-deoxygluconokinase [Micromonospora nigra]|uniref:2-dehydro-3-deoxygluconokinase n=1 Tax=Micromonospora nigra TaxID=145857 RepID=A0A1C6T0D6_9ACTN|nr:sugar kinase [Micromonospora nigra]SCL35119.1 2-dehydro-3-deoxygluconokinase [Micromonospora nigra]